MSLKKNVLANYLGQGWTALMGIAFVPLYIEYMGMEAYGLIGVFAILQAWLALLDMGMTPTLSREMARYTAGAHTAQSIRDLLRSLEVICFATALLIGIVIWLSASWLATHWLQAQKLPVEDVAQAISVMGFVVAFRFIESLYRGAILGLQRQVLFNVVNASLATLRGVGVLGVLAWISPTIEAFFLWQGAISIVVIVVLAGVVQRHLPPSERAPSFSRDAIKGVWQFARGMMAITFLSLLLMQTDKVLLSSLLSLEAFGYYTLAASVCGVLYLLVVPIAQSFSPRFTELATRCEAAALTSAYHQAAQLVAVLVVPAALVLMFFGENLLVVWAGNAALAHEAAPLVALLAIGWMFNALMNPPYMLQLAYGWTSFAVWMNVVAVMLLVPAIFLVTPRYGAVGAASVWAVLNAGYVLIAIHFMHRRLLTEEKWRWYLHDIFFPFISAAGIVAVSWMVHPLALSRTSEAVWLFATGTAALGASTMAAPLLRARTLKWIKGQDSGRV